MSKSKIGTIIKYVYRPWAINKLAQKINEKWFLKSCRHLFHLKSILSQKNHFLRKSTKLDEFISVHLCKSSDVKYFVKLIILSACPKKKFLRVCLLEGEQLLCCWHLWLWGQRGQNQNFSWITSDTPPTLRRRAGFDSAFFFHFRKSQSNAQRIEEIESSERKNNLIIKGIKQERRLERPSHLQGMIKKFFKQTLKLSGVQLEEVRHSVFFSAHQ